MSTKDRAEWGLVGHSLYLSATYILEWLQKRIPVLPMFGIEVPKARKDSIVESRRFAVCLLMLYCCCQVFIYEEGAHHSEEMFD